MKRQVSWLGWTAAVALAAALACGCSRKAPGAGKTAAPLIKLPSVIAAAEGCEWVRLKSPERFVASGGAGPLEERFRDRRLVAEPMAGEWFLLVRHDAQGRHDIPAQPRPGTATADPTPQGDIAVTFTVPAASRTAVSDLTRRNLGRSVAIVIDGLIYLAPQMQSQVSATVQITLPGTEKEQAGVLADRLARWQSLLSLRAVVLAGENSDEPELRRKFQQLASGGAAKK